MRIDAHQHVWRVDRGDYGWLKPELGVLYRDYAIADLVPHLEYAGIDGTVLVQAAPTVAETEYLLRIAADEPRVHGVVGWIDFAAVGAPADLERLAVHPGLKGLRPMIQDIDDTDWMLQKELTPAFEALSQTGLVFDALVLPRHLENLSTLCARHPDLRVVIDHAAKPEIANWGTDLKARSAWSAHMARLARDTSCSCKFSGLVTESGANWSIDHIAPFAESLFEHFGPERLLFGSDWPVVNLAGGYARWWDTAQQLCAGLSAQQRDAVFGGNAIRTYGL